MSAESVKRNEEERARYVNAFNSTMISIWKEKMILLGVWRTGKLYRSIIPTKMLNRDGRYLDVVLEQSFNTYGIFVNFGTGREIPRGNPGDIGRAKMRQAKPWFSKKYYASVMNLRDFYADNVGRYAAHVIAEQLSSDKLRESVTL